MCGRSLAVARIGRSERGATAGLAAGIPGALHQREPLPLFSSPWLEVEPDPGADRDVPGYIEFVRFRAQPSGLKGRALVARLAGPGDAPPLFRGEKRTWALSLCDRGGSLAIGYSYLEPAKPDDLWVYDPRLRRVERQSHPPRPSQSPTSRLCDALTASGLAEEVEILQRTTGRVKDVRKLRAAISPIPRWSGCR